MFSRHYNSFHPKLGFFLHLDDVVDQVQQGTVSKASGSPGRHRVTQARADESSQAKDAFYEAILKEPLVSIYTGDEFKNLPRLKEHLEEEWSKRGRKAKAKLKEGEKRSAETLEGAPPAKK